MTSLPMQGLLGIRRESKREAKAMPEPIKNTKDGELSQISPIAIGRITAAI